MTRREADKLTPADYEEVLTDHRRLVRELDVAMHGEEGAAMQASLCDLIEPARRLREENRRLLIVYKHAIDCLEKANASAAKNGLPVYTLGFGGGGVTPNKHSAGEKWRPQ